MQKPELRRNPTFTILRPSLGSAALVLLLALSMLVTLPSFAVDWVEFIEVSDTRLSAVNELGAGDTMEKDMMAGDVDRDGDDDMVIMRKLPFSVVGPKRNVLFMNENGVFVDRTATLAPDMLDEADDRDVMLVDIDGDDWLDIVTATTFSEQPRIYMNLGEDMGGTWLGFDFDAADGRLPVFSPAPQFCALAVGDVNGDDFPDIYFVDYDNTLEDRLVINNGNGFFTDETTTRLTTAMAESVFGTDAQIIDIDGDGDNDIIKDNASGSAPPPGSSPPAVRVYYNDGTGNFDFMQLAYTEAPYMIQAADFNMDGRNDIFVVDDGQDGVLFNTGNDAQGRAQFTFDRVNNSPKTSFFGGNTEVADLNADGILDILVADVDTDIEGCDDRELALLRGEGTVGNVEYSDPLGNGTRNFNAVGTFDVEVLDFNGDGVLDIWAGTCTGNRLFEGLGMMFASGFEDGNTDEWSGATP